MICFVLQMQYRKEAIKLDDRLGTRKRDVRTSDSMECEPVRSERMDKVQQLLSELCNEIERQLKPNLIGPIGSIVAGYLPQTWVFETERGAYTVFLDAEGNVRVFPGTDKNRDVTIQWRERALISVLETRSRSSITDGDYPNVFVHSDKGRAAFSYLKKYVGL